ALLERLRLGEDAAQRGERDRPGRGEAVLDPPGLLADDEHGVVAEERVDLVDAPGGGVLDGDDGDVGLVGEKGGDGGANARVAREMALEVASGEELLGGEVAVGVL